MNIGFVGFFVYLTFIKFSTLNRTIQNSEDAFDFYIIAVVHIEPMLNTVRS